MNDGLRAILTYFEAGPMRAHDVAAEQDDKDGKTAVGEAIRDATNQGYLDWYTDGHGNKYFQLTEAGRGAVG